MVATSNQQGAMFSAQMEEVSQADSDMGLRGLDERN